jgi:hypothetical protein
MQSRNSTLAQQAFFWGQSGFTPAGVPRKGPLAPFLPAEHRGETSRLEFLFEQRFRSTEPEEGAESVPAPAGKPNSPYLDVLRVLMSAVRRQLLPTATPGLFEAPREPARPNIEGLRSIREEDPKYVERLQAQRRSAALRDEDRQERELLSRAYGASDAQLRYAFDRKPARPKPLKPSVEPSQRWCAEGPFDPAGTWRSRCARRTSSSSASTSSTCSHESSSATLRAKQVRPMPM